MKKVFIETQNVQRLRKIITSALDTEKGRPGMAAVWGEAGCGKTVAAQSLYVTSGYYLRAMEGVTQCAFLQDLCFEVKGSRPRSSAACKREIIAALDGERQAIFVDEADRLNVHRIEDLRDIYDMTGAPIILIGEQGLPTLLEARSRIIDRIPNEFRLAFGKVEAADVAMYAMEAAGLSLTPEACTVVHTATHGNFRRIHNALLSIESTARAAGTAEVDAQMARTVCDQQKARRKS